MDVYLQMTMDALQRIGPVRMNDSGELEGGQMTVVERGPDGAVARTYVHCAILGAVSADTPAQRKVSKWAGHGAYVGCGRCLMLGTAGTSSNGHAGMRFLGYTEDADVLQGVVNRNLPAKARAGDAVLKLTHAEHVLRAQFVDTVRKSGVGQTQMTNVVRNYGCHGMPALVARLPYVNFAMMWAPPLYHAALYGVVLRFWNLLLCKFTRGDVPKYALSREARAIMTERALHFKMTNDQNRPYNDIVTRRGNWVMEDWLRWLCEYSRYVLQDNGRVAVMHKVAFVHNGREGEVSLAQLWEWLRDGLLYHFRYAARPGGQDHATAAAASAHNLRCFAVGDVGLQLRHGALGNRGWS